MPIEPEAKNDQDTDDPKRHSNECAEASRSLLRPDGGSESPLAGEIPDSHAEMERRGENSNHKKRQVPGILHVLGNIFVRGLAVGEPALRIQVPCDVSESNQSGVTLCGVKPIPYPRIGGDVGLALDPNINSVAAVKKHWQKNGSPFHKEAERNSLQFLGSGVVFRAAHQSGAVGPEMLCQECANGEYAGKRMKLSEEIT